MTVDERVIMEIANSVWVEDRLTVKQDFINALINYFDAETRNFSVSDPEIKDIINQWIEDHTNGLIKEMIDEIPADIAMILINAIYFNGKWRYKFDEKDTEEKTFYLEDGSTVDVEMMSNETTYKTYFGEDMVMVELPYGQGNFVMDVLLPNEGNTTADIISAMNPGNWNDWISNLYEKEIQLYMPRFKYGYKKELKDILSDMGMGIAFTGAADFSNISEQDLFISKVLHQTFIENNEEGTEAAAVTVVMMELTSAPAGPFTINLNRPFVYVIRETSTNTIVFMGLTGNPASD
jgi:serpin B